MLRVIHFKDSKVSILGFENEEDLIKTCKMLDTLYKRGKEWPRFYLIKDEKTTDKQMGEIQNFLTEMERQKVDLDTVQRVVDREWESKIKKSGTGIA